jgi:Holliday junction resolvase RusA-like endonuclease
MPELLINVYGRPAPQGSKKLVASNRFIEASKYLPAWRKAVSLAALEAINLQGWDMLEDAVELECVFYLDRPGTVPEKKRKHPIKPPDVSKLLRAVEDSLTDAGVYADDAQIVKATAFKFYADTREPGAFVIVRKYAN